MKCRHGRRRGLTMIEVLLLIGIVVCVFIMLFPALQAAREKARRPVCLDNMKRLGLAYHAYAQASHGYLAPASGVTRDDKGKITAVDGWSWQVLLLPYLDNKNESGDVAIVSKDLYNKLDVAHGRPLTEPEGAKGTPHADVLATQLPGLLCPSFGGSPYTDFGGKKAGITNYKPLGATHIESLSVASPNPLTPKYKPGPWPNTEAVRSNPPHPDGYCFPGASVTFAAVAKSGTANTLLLVESLEQRHARWTVGVDAAVVGFPRNVEFEHCKDGGYVPKGHQSAMDKQPEADSTYWAYHTYLDWNYSRNPYDAADGTSGKRYGPSSNHPGLVDHLLMDASARGIAEDIDITIYMAAIRGPWRSIRD
jgi:hypothetical protein